MFYVLSRARACMRVEGVQPCKQHTLNSQDTFQARQDCMTSRSGVSRELVVTLLRACFAMIGGCTLGRSVFA